MAEATPSSPAPNVPPSTQTNVEQPDLGGGGGGGDVATPTSSAPGTPPIVGSPSGNAPQRPAPLKKESFLEGLIRGLHGESYVADAQGNIVDARATAKSGKGLFGSILGNLAIGAMVGGANANLGGRPHEGPEVNTGEKAMEWMQKRDETARNQAASNFSRTMEAKKMSAEEARSAAEVNNMAATTAETLQRTAYGKEDHELNVDVKKAELEEHHVNIMKSIQQMDKDHAELYDTLSKMDIDPEAFFTSWEDASAANAHNDIVSGRYLPLYNGKGTASDDRGAGMFNVTDMKNRALTHDVTYRTYTADKAGNPVETVHTLKAGTPVWDYVTQWQEGQRNLNRITGMQQTKAAVELKKSEAEKNRAEAAKDYALAQKAREGLNDIPSAAKLIVGGDVAQMKDVASMRGDARMKLFTAIHDEAVKQGKDPNEYSPARLESKSKMLVDYSEGKTADQLTTFNTFIGHAGDAWDINNEWVRSGDKLATKTMAWINKNAVSNPEYVKFMTALEPVRKEFMSFLNANRAEHTDDIATMQTVLSDQKTPSEIVAALKQLATSANIRMSNIDQKFYRNFKTSYEDQMKTSMYSDESKAALSRMGLRPADPAGKKPTTQQPTQQKPTRDMVPAGKVPAWDKDGNLIGYADDAKGTNYHKF